MTDPADPGPFSRDQRRVLAGVLDTIVPPDADRKLPGAGALGLVDYIADVVRRSPELEPILASGCSRLEESMRARGAEGFTQLSMEARTEVLNESTTGAPGFLSSLIFHTYTGYYQNGAVLAALGTPPRPPHPDGYALEPGDLTLLDAVRKRAKLYREV